VASANESSDMRTTMATQGWIIIFINGMVALSGVTDRNDLQTLKPLLVLNRKRFVCFSFEQTHGTFLDFLLISHCQGKWSEGGEACADTRFFLCTLP
jgi:hypothetical protein